MTSWIGSLVCHSLMATALIVASQLTGPSRDRDSDGYVVGTEVTIKIERRKD